MKYINELKDGDRIVAIYLCKGKVISATKAGKDYATLTLQDKTGQLEGKIWELDSPDICEFDVLDYVEVTGMITSYNGALQLKIDRTRKATAGEYDPADYLPVSKKDIEVMYNELVGLINSVTNQYLHTLLKSMLIDNVDMMQKFKTHSAARSVHHSFVGGLLQHSLSVANTCDFIAKSYPNVNRDLLITAAILHDIGKLNELSAFPVNDYTDEGYLLGHIVMGCEMIHEYAGKITDFPVVLENQLKHCILAHHGKLEFGSPKRPALIEALALNYADDLDANMEVFTEAIEDKGNEWLSYNKFLDNNIRRTI